MALRPSKSRMPNQVAGTSNDVGYLLALEIGEVVDAGNGGDHAINDDRAGCVGSLSPGGRGPRYGASCGEEDDVSLLRAV